MQPKQPLYNVDCISHLTVQSTTHILSHSYQAMMSQRTGFKILHFLFVLIFLQERYLLLQLICVVQLTL